MLCSFRRPRSSVLWLFILLTTGCGDSSGVGKTYPVLGKITFKNEPWTVESTMILLKPDRSKGNQSPYEPVGTSGRAGCLHHHDQRKRRGAARMVQSAGDSHGELRRTSQRQESAPRTALDSAPQVRPRGNHRSHHRGGRTSQSERLRFETLTLSGGR